jgi:cell division protease FtsH
MSSAPEKQTQKPERPKSPERFNLKLLLIWLGIISVIGLLLAVSPAPRSQIQQKKIGQVMRDIEAGKVKNLSITPDPTSGSDKMYVLRGELVTENTGTEPKDPKDAKAPEPIKFESAGILTESSIEKIQQKIPDTVTYPKANTNLEIILLQLLPTLIIGGLVVFFIYRLLKNANKGAMSFAKSRAKLLGKDKERATFKDVAGCDEAKEDIQEIVEFLREPKKFQKIGARIPKGVLLVGPPGTGKTLLARAVAGEADVPFFSISGSDFVEMFVGVGAARVRDMFEQARKSAPSIIFIDEIDAVGRQRGAGLGGGHDEREQTLNSMLVEMDGIEGHEGLIVIAATNRADVLDAALLRPGRFDRHVYVELPDINGREEILQVHAKKVKLAAGVDLKHIARITTGCSGADLANLLNESALLAARHNKKEIETVDIEQANDKISFGAERRKLMDDEDRRNTAYHEAGHAIVQLLVEDAQMKLHKVTIIPRGRALGMAMLKPSKDIIGHTKKQLLNRICMAMAGRIGEEVVTGDFSNGASSDIKQATSIARHMVCDWGMSSLGPVSLNDTSEQPFYGRDMGRSGNSHSDDTARAIDSEIHRIIDEQYKRAAELLGSHADALRKVAEALLQYETLDALHVSEVIQFGEIRTSVDYRPLTRRQRDEEKLTETVAESVNAPAEFGGAPEPTPA